jgi:hypothetical protein
MFLVFMVALIVFAMIGLGSVFGSGLAAFGAIILLPIVLLKVVLVLTLFGFVGRRLTGRRSSWDEDHPGWVGRSRARQENPSASREERFEEWHRMAHARQEVDDHTPPVEE